MRSKLLPLFSMLCALALCAGLLTACGGNKKGGSTAAKIRRPDYTSEETQFAAPASGDTIAVFDTSAGEIRAVLYPSLAPQACDNFIALAESGFYNGTTFYRTVSGALAEGGLDANGASLTKWGGSGYPAETTDALHHYAGALCAAMNENGQGGSVFYFVQALPEAPSDELTGQLESAGCRAEVLDAYKTVGGLPYLDNTDTVFGQVYSGMDTVDAIAQSAVDDNDAPLEAVTINSVTITTFEG